MQPTPNILFLATEGDFTRILFHKIHPNRPFQKVILENPVSKKKFLQRRAKKLGYWQVFGQIAFMAMVHPLLKWTSQKRVNEILEKTQASTLPIPERVIMRVSSINHPDTVALLKEMAPDLVIVNGTRILSKKVIEAVKAPIINIHVGITPMYRGVHGGYWALAKNDVQNFGVTIHYIDPGIDTGDILLQKRITPGKKDNFFTYPYLQITEGAKLLLQATEREIAGNNAILPSDGSTSGLFYHPTIWKYLSIALKKGIF